MKTMILVVLGLVGLGLRQMGLGFKGNILITVEVSCSISGV